MLGIGHGETRVKRHLRVLIELFRIQRHGLPSYSTIRRILMGVDFDQLAASVNQLAKNYWSVSMKLAGWERTRGTMDKYLNIYPLNLP